MKKTYEFKNLSCAHCEYEEEHHHHDHCECDGEHHHHDHCECGDEHHHHNHCECGDEHHHHDHDEKPHVKAEEGKGPATVFIVNQLSCAHCAGKMEEQINALPDVHAATLTYATKQLRVWADDAPALLPKIQKICTSIEPDVSVNLRSSSVKKQKQQTEKGGISENTKVLLELGAGILLFLSGNLIKASFPTLSTVFFIVGYLVLGAKILWTAFRNIIRGQVFDENFLMSIATIGAFVIGEYAEAVGVMLFYRIGEYFEDRAVARSRSQIMDVIDMRPEVVNLVLPSGEVSVIDAEEAQIGDILMVRPGDRIPLDGIITTGETMIDTSPVTGEPVPVSASVGTPVTSGCMNTSGVIQMKVEKILEESMVSRIMNSVETVSYTHLTLPTILLV